ncbi:MAG TPA: hypothetical protein VM346_11435 [Sphingomicrobium sp.]|nr:hypothetical protein [Sphingomicrobium sp.]
MRYVLLIAGILFVQACMAQRLPPTPDWFAGTWLAQPDGERDLTACVGGVSVSYLADGRFSHWEWSGEWRLEGDLLIEMATLDHEMVPPDEVPLGKPESSRIERIGRDEMRQTLPNGERVTYLRCPENR